MKLDIYQMLCGDPVRIRYVKRFSTCRVLSPESVAEHSYFTAFYALLVAEWVADEGIDDLDVERLLRRALLHDLEEARTGDMPRFFKHQDETARAEIERVAHGSFREVLGKTLDGDVLDRFTQTWCQAKDDSLEGRILSFADFLSVLAYVTEEMRSNNLTMREHLISMKSYSAGFDHGKYDFIRPLVTQAQDILQREVL